MVTLSRAALHATPQCSWPLLIFLPTFMLAFLAQRAFLNCACCAGPAFLAAGMALDGLVLARVVVAYARRERNRAWLVYVLALLTSVLWVPMYVEFVWSVWGRLAGG